MTAKLAPHLAGHQVTRAYDIGLHGISNGNLLAAAQAEGFDLVLTVDGNISAQQNMVGRSVAVIILEAPRSSIEFLEPLVPQLCEAIDKVQPGEVRVIRGGFEQ